MKKIRNAILKHKREPNTTRVKKSKFYFKNCALKFLFLSKTTDFIYT